MLAFRYIYIKGWSSLADRSLCSDLIFFSQRTGRICLASKCPRSLPLAITLDHTSRLFISVLDLSSTKRSKSSHLKTLLVFSINSSFECLYFASRSLRCGFVGAGWSLEVDKLMCWSSPVVLSFGVRDAKKTRFQAPAPRLLCP